MNTFLLDLFSDSTHTTFPRNFLPHVVAADASHTSTYPPITMHLIAASPGYSQSPDLTISILDHLCMALDLTKTQRKSAEDRYGTITRLLAAPESSLARFSPHLHPQGSFLQKTMVKPMAGVEFDIDLICILHSARHLRASELFRLVVDELKKRYPDLVVKDRCCRIDYAGEFHLDIIPACPEWRECAERILIPDRRLEEMLPSCPKLFAAWLDEAAQRMPRFITSLAARDVFNAKSAAVIEPLPDYDGMMQEPLRRFIQIFKAARNHHYQNRRERSPSSIVLTTLAAHAYKRAVECRSYDSMLDVFHAVAADLHASIQVLKKPDGVVRFELKNPLDDREDFMENWDNDKASYRAFLEWQQIVVSFIDKMTDAEMGHDGVDHAKKRLAGTFGESAANAAIRGIAAARREGVANGRGGYLANGLLVGGSHASARTTPKQTFHGSDR